MEWLLEMYEDGGMKYRRAAKLVAICAIVFTAIILAITIVMSVVLQEELSLFDFALPLFVVICAAINIAVNVLIGRCVEKKYMQASHARLSEK